MATGISTFVDWEDVGRGPLVFDVASAAVGACFLHDSVVDSVRLASSTPQRAALKVECLRVEINDAGGLLHAIDATPARWRGDAGSSPLDRSSTAASSLSEELSVHPTHCRLRKMLVAYSRGRRRAVLLEPLARGWRPRSASVCLGFTKAEAAALPGLMEANAYACALYRFYAFHVADPGAPRGAKRSYREMPSGRVEVNQGALGDELGGRAGSARRDPRALRGHRRERRVIYALADFV